MAGVIPIATFAAFLQRGLQNFFGVSAHTMAQAAEIIEKEAKAELGTYQRTDTGMFPPWDELADNTKANRRRLGYPENEPGLVTRAMHDSITHAAERNEAAVGSDDDDMVWFELGTVHQPPRSTLGVAAVRKEKEVAHLIGRATVMHLFGGDMGGLLKIP